MGVCTKFLDSLETGDSLDITPRLSPISFGLKLNSSFDRILLIANGTGVAPFIGFIQELLCNHVMNVKLIYGYRKDRLYDVELDGFIKSGVTVIEAISGNCNPVDKKYVQDFITVDDLDSLIYVCGSGAMGRGVDQVLSKLKVERDGGSAVEAIKYWREDRRETFLKELWG
jgi:sulfite reductase alpha subunit-like flavoprotein